MLLGTFRNRKQADRAYDAVTDRDGYTDKSVSLLMSDKTRAEYFGEGERYETKEGSKAMKGAGVGSALGGTAGGIAGALLAASGAVALPALGIAIAGPLAATLAGAGAGGAGGSLIGALVGAGIKEERAKRYESDIKDGGIVIGVTPRNVEDTDYFESEWRSIGAERVYLASEGTWDLLKARLLETFDGLKNIELEKHRYDRGGLETYIHNRTGTSRSTVSAKIDEARSDVGHTFTSHPSADTTEIRTEKTEVRVEETDASESTETSSSVADSVEEPADEDDDAQRAASWEAFKRELLSKHDELRGSELDQYRGRRSALVDHIADRTGKPRDEADETVTRVTRNTEYAFTSTSRRTE